MSRRTCLHRGPQLEGDKPAKTYAIGFLHLDIAKVQTAAGKLYLFLAIDRTSNFAFVQLVDMATAVTASVPCF